jgi:hypothetical protein
MRKLLSSITLLTSLVILLSSCAKERDSRDAALCNQGWTLNSASSSYVQTETIKADASLGINGSTITDSSTEFFSNILSSTKTVTNQPEAAPESWDKVVNQYVYSNALVFQRGGQYQMHITQVLSKVTHSTNAVQDPDYLVEGESAVFDYSGSWHWLNTTDTKRSIYMENMGVYDIQVDENLLTLRKVQDQLSSSNSFFASNPILITRRNSSTEFLHFSPR